MSPSRPTLDVLETVTRRSDVLSALAETPAAKRELVDQLECSRSTIDRAVRELEWLELVYRDSGVYNLTVTGRLALTEHRRSTAIFETIDESSAVLSEIPSGAPLSTALLEGADVSKPPSHAPHEPLQEFARTLSRADRIRSSSTAERLPGLRKQLYEWTVEGDLDAELLFTEELAAFVRSTYPQLLRDIAIDGDVEFYVIDSLPYELSIVESPEDTRVVLFVLDETEIEAIIQNDSVAALEWATAVYRSFREQARPLTLPEDG